MNRQKLIARRVQEYRPVKIATKNWYKDKNHETFKGWTEPPNSTDPWDSALALEAQRFLKAHLFAVIVGCQLDEEQSSLK